ncbi:phenylalanine--tRNA ligase subunit beta [Candidatus Saccharibacteria bacterium]|nr:phenylalanine--tRNA ligase subunit beta [Candidatus Saccharibacteria bacterium]
MRISLNEIKKLVPAAAKVDTDELIKLIGSRLVEVEGKIDLSAKYQNAYIVKVVECEPIPETHLHLCQVDAGDISFSDRKLGRAALSVSEKDDIPASKELVQVVCGAPNVRAGMLAVWLAPGAIVPQTFGEENFKLDVRKLRGYESHGMLAGLDELDLGDDHSGIVEINPHQKYISTSGEEQEVKPGDTFAEVFDLNDIILDIENKSLTHRPDTFGLIGFAREVAGILGVEFNDGNQSQIATSGDLLRQREQAIGSSPVTTGRATGAPEAAVATDNFGESISINISNTNLCPRYSCAIIEMSDALSDDKYLTNMDVFLAKAGMRGISKIVDVTNYLMLMTGQPLHAFDYDKFVRVGGDKSPKIIVRAAKDGEELQLLDGKTIKCLPHDILITSNDVPVALAGAMGGANTEIDATTSRIILESATFSLYNLRKTQMSHGIFSEAITRFTKGQPASQTVPVLETAISMLGGKAVGFSDSYPHPTTPSVVKITADNINNLLGTKYTTDQIIKTLENVGFVVKADDSELSITAPLWRTDIHIKEDIIEEVGRLLGYDNIPLSLPTRPFIGTSKDPLLDLKSTLRNVLSDKLAAHELLTYSFVSRKLQENVGENPADSYEIINSISPELQCFRQSIIPSLLEKTRDNLKSGYRDFSLYEINQVTKKSYGFDDDHVPVLYTHLAFVTTGDFYQMKANLVAMLESLGFKNLQFRASDNHFPYFEPLHSATIQTPHICCGEIKSAVLKRLKIDQPISAFEISLDQLLPELPSSAAKMPQLSKFPSVERDLTLKVKSDIQFAAAESAIGAGFVKASASQNLGELITSITPVSIYQPTPDASTKNLSFHLDFASPKKTLENTEISAIMDTVSKSVKEAVGAEIV